MICITGFKPFFLMFSFIAMLSSILKTIRQKKREVLDFAEILICYLENNFKNIKSLMKLCKSSLIWDNLFKNGPTEIYGSQSLKIWSNDMSYLNRKYYFRLSSTNFTRSILEYIFSKIIQLSRLVSLWKWSITISLWLVNI